MTVIIVEGVDGAGKTTLINELSSQLNYDVVKGSSFELSSCTNEELYNKFNDMTTLDNVVFDRFIYSNEVYAPLYKDFALLTDEQRREIERKMSHKAIIVYLYADTETLIDRINVRGDDYVTVDKLDTIKEKYDESMSKVRGIGVLRFNTTNTSTIEIVEFISSLIK
ncbi:hypothetical protein D7X33_42715 [Butyricicoccus sp. 1XD8-22]|nr:hypothetical protein D7X33_42715 [Butyricicoccus sp. 1XD8-22]